MKRPQKIPKTWAQIRNEHRQLDMFGSRTGVSQKKLLGDWRPKVKK